MNKALPKVTESQRELQELIRTEKDRIRKDRLQLLYSIKVGLLGTRLEAANLLGKSRNTIGRWLAVYEEDGLEALLAIQYRGRKSA